MSKIGHEFEFILKTKICSPSWQEAVIANHTKIFIFSMGSTKSVLLVPRSGLELEKISG